MPIIIFIFSIFATTLTFWFLNKFWPFKICPICAGVSLTWLWIVAGVAANLLEPQNWKLLLAVAMGGTVVGIAYQGEKKYPQMARDIFKWKMPVILIGFLFVWWTLENISWLSVGIDIVVLCTITYFYFLKHNISKLELKENPRIKELEEKLEECCD